MTNKKEITVKAKPGKIFKKVTCYSTNTAEMSQELYKALIDPATDELKDIKLSVAVEAIQAALNQARETALECEGADIQIPSLPGTPGIILDLVLASIGLDLNAPITVDSPLGV